MNVPRTLAAVRAESYTRHAWPGALAPVFARNGAAMAVTATAGIALFAAGFALLDGPAAWRRQQSFYALMPHAAMAWLFGLVFLAALFAMGMGVRRFWRATGPAGARPKALWQAARTQQAFATSMAAAPAA